MSNICILFHCACIACTLAYALALLAIFFSLFLHFSTKLIHTIPLHAPTLERYRFIQRPLAVWLWVLLQWFFAFQILLAINFQWFLLQHCCSGILSHTHTHSHICFLSSNLKNRHCIRLFVTYVAGVILHEKYLFLRIIVVLCICRQWRVLVAVTCIYSITYAPYLSRKSAILFQIHVNLLLVQLLHLISKFLRF